MLFYTLLLVCLLIFIVHDREKKPVWILVGPEFIAENPGFDFAGPGCSI